MRFHYDGEEADLCRVLRGLKGRERVDGDLVKRRRVRVAKKDDVDLDWLWGLRGQRL